MSVPRESSHMGRSSATYWWWSWCWSRRGRHVVCVHVCMCVWSLSGWCLKVQHAPINIVRTRKPRKNWAPERNRLNAKPIIIHHQPTPAIRHCIQTDYWVLYVWFPSVLSSTNTAPANDASESSLHPALHPTSTVAFSNRPPSIRRCATTATDKFT